MDKENINSAENIENDMFDEQENLSQDKKTKYSAKMRIVKITI